MFLTQTRPYNPQNIAELALEPLKIKTVSINTDSVDKFNHVNNTHYSAKNSFLVQDIHVDITVDIAPVCQTGPMVKKVPLTQLNIHA